MRAAVKAWIRLMRSLVKSATAGEWRVAGIAVVGVSDGIYTSDGGKFVASCKLQKMRTVLPARITATAIP